MKKLAIFLLFFLVCSVSFAQIESDNNCDPRALRHTGPATFTGPLAITGQTSLASTTFSGVATHGADIIMLDGGEIEIATGTSAHLALRLRSDPDTGLYSQGAGYLNFVTNGVERFSSNPTYYIDCGGISRFAGVLYANAAVIGGNQLGFKTIKFGLSSSRPDSGFGEFSGNAPCVISSLIPCQAWSSATGTTIFTDLTVASNTNFTGLIDGCSEIASITALEASRTLDLAFTTQSIATFATSLDASVTAQITAVVTASAGYTVGNPVTFSGDQLNQILPVWAATETIGIEDGEIVRLRATVGLKSPGMALFYFDAALSREDGTLTFIGNNNPASPTYIHASPGATLYGAELYISGNTVGVKASGTDACIGKVMEFELRR